MLIPMLGLVLAVAGGTAIPRAPTNHLETIKVAEGIYVFKPKIDWSHGNGVAIIGPAGVFFIDTFIQFNYAEEAIAKLREITKLPVRYVLNTHYHNDHVIGNGVFKLAFPESHFIAHDSTVDYMERRIKPAVEGEGASIPGALAQTKEEIANWKQKGTNDSIVGSMRAFWQLQLREIEEYQREYHPAPFVNADITFSDTLSFKWGARTLKLIHLEQHGHSTGDVIVWIPEERLVVTGDIVVGPTPYATHYNSPGMVTSLQALIAMNPAVIIPGHGVVQRDLTYTRLLERAFREYRQAAEAALAAGTPLTDALQKISFPEIDQQFVQGDEMRAWAYRRFFVRNLIIRTYRPTNDG